jgi:hypothetical protein
VTGDRRKALTLGLRMIGFILRFWLTTLGRARRPALHRAVTRARGGAR